MNLDDRISQLVRDALDPMLAERLSDHEERLVQRLVGALQGVQVNADSPALLTPEDIAARLKVDARTIRRMVSTGTFPPPIPISPGRSRWRPDEVEAWLEDQVQKDEAS